MKLNVIFLYIGLASLTFVLVYCLRITMLNPSIKNIIITSIIGIPIILALFQLKKISKTKVNDKDEDIPVE
jgi:uncharacterized membrane protein